MNKRKRVRASLDIAGLATLALTILEVIGVIKWPWYIIVAPIWLTAYWLLVEYFFTTN